MCERLARSNNPPESLGFELYVPYVDLIQTRFRILLHVDVDRKMGVDVSHLVLESSRDTNDQIIDESLDSPESSHVLACAMVKFDVDDILRGMGEAD